MFSSYSCLGVLDDIYCRSMANKQTEAIHGLSTPTPKAIGGEYEESIKFAKRVKKALNKVQWKDIICMLTQLEKLSEGSRSIHKGPTNGTADEDKECGSIQPENQIRLRSSALLNPSVLTTRYGGNKNPLIGTNHFGYPVDIRPSGEALQKYSSYSYMKDSESDSRAFTGGTSFQSHSLSSSMEVLLSGSEVLPALWLMDYNSSSEVYSTPAGKQRKHNEHVFTPEPYNIDDDHGEGPETKSVGALFGMNTYYSGRVLNCNSLADDILAPASFLCLHSDPEGKVGSDILLSNAIKKSSERMKRMSIAASIPQAPITPSNSSLDSSTHVFGGFKKAIGSATKKSISVLTLGSIHGSHDVEQSHHEGSVMNSPTPAASRKKAYDCTLSEDSEDYKNREIDPYEVCLYGIEGDDSIREVRSILHFQRGVTNAKNLQAVFRSVADEPATPYSGERVYLADNLVTAILERNNLRIQQALPDVNLHVSSVMLNMRETVGKDGVSNHTAKRRTFLTISLEDIDFTLSASPSVPPPVKTPTKKRRKSVTNQPSAKSGL